MGQKRIGRDLVIRRLFEVDQEDIRNHFRRLDTNSRRARFCGSVGDAGLTSYVRTLFRFDNILIGAFVEGQLRGLAELRGVLNIWPSKAEVAFSVDPAWQDNGIGDALFERVITMARNRCVRSIRLMCLKENIRMRRLATKHGAQLCVDQDVMHAFLHPGSPTPATVASEIIGETRWFARMLDQ